MWLLITLGVLALLVVLQADMSATVPMVDVQALVGRPIDEVVTAIKTEKPNAVIVAYRTRDTDSSAQPHVMAMQPNVHYLGVDKSDTFLGMVPLQYVERNIKHSGILLCA